MFPHALNFVMDSNRKGECHCQNSWSLHVSLGVGLSPNCSQPSTLALLEATTFSSCKLFFCNKSFICLRAWGVCPKTSTKGIPHPLHLRCLFSVYLGSRILAPGTCSPPTSKSQMTKKAFFLLFFGLGSQDAIQIHASTTTKGCFRDPWEHLVCLDQETSPSRQSRQMGQDPFLSGCEVIKETCNDPFSDQKDAANTMYI